MRLLVLVLALCGCAHVGPPRVFDDEPRVLSRRSAPILLLHGLLLFGTSVRRGLTSFDQDIVKALEADGFDVFLPALPPIAPPADRAEVLLAAIDEVLRKTGATRVNLIAHSQSGIDARVLLDDPRAAGKVASVVTLSSPHHGTPFAEIALELRGSLSESFLDRTAKRIDESRGWPGREGRLRAMAATLTPAAMERFNLEHPTTPVPLFSLAATPELAHDGACDGGKWPAPTHPGRRGLVMHVGSALLDRAGSHESDDGIVPTRSEKFGIFLGCASLEHGGWLHAQRRGLDVVAFLLELARGLRDVEMLGASGMDAHIPALAALVGAAR